MKFGQLIEYNMRNFFFEKSYTKNVVEKLFSNPFLKSENWENLWIINIKFYPVCFYYIASWGLLKYIETKQQTTHKALLKKEVWN